MRAIKICILGIVALLGVQAQAQETPLVVKWHPDFTLTQEINPRLSATVGLCGLWGLRDFRLEDDTLMPAQERLDGRLFLNYKLTDKLTLSGGYMYRVYASDLVGFEHRITEQLVYKTKVGAVGLAHRVRVEQRIFENAYLNRLRYRIGSKIPLNGKSGGNLSLLLTEEVVSAFNSEKFGLENRFEVGLGYKFSDQLKMDFKVQHRFKGWDKCQVAHLVTKVAYKL